MKVMRPGANRTLATVPTPTVTSAPAAPLTLAQLPSTPPQVSYQGGMLTIVAENASLGDILREVHRSTGAAIEVPGSANERVVAKIGPGPARDVLAELLNGSAFNYVMIGSATDPTTLASVMLTTKSGGGAQSAAPVYEPPPQYVPQQAVMAPGTGPGGPVVQQPASDEEADAEDKDDEEADQNQTAGQAQNGAAPTPDGSQPPNAGPKTPEQILEMLRQHSNGQPIPHLPNQPPDNN